MIWLTFADVTKRYVSTQAEMALLLLESKRWQRVSLEPLLVPRQKLLGCIRWFGCGCECQSGKCSCLGRWCDNRNQCNSSDFRFCRNRCKRTDHANFGGANVSSGDQVSVGSVGYERQIKMYPGAVGTSSTDAINGRSIVFSRGDIAETN